MLASSKDLLSAFGTTDSDKICSEILLKGEIQVSEQERGALYETVFRDVASIVAEKTINPETNRSYTVLVLYRLSTGINQTFFPFHKGFNDSKLHAPNSILYQHF